MRSGWAQHGVGTRILVRATPGESWAGWLSGAPGGDEKGRSPQHSPRRGNARRPAGHQPRGWGQGAGKPTKPLTSRRKGQERPACCNNGSRGVGRKVRPRDVNADASQQITAQFAAKLGARATPPIYSRGAAWSPRARTGALTPARGPAPRRGRAGLPGRSQRLRSGPFLKTHAVRL